MVSDSERQRLFDNWSKSYAPDVDDAHFPFIGYRDVLLTLIRGADFKEEHKILELGVGTGNLTRLIPVPPNQILGVDFSEKMLLRARQILPGAHFLQADLLNEDWIVQIKGPFDRVLSAYTMHEFPDSVKCDLIKRVSEKLLKPNGAILIGDISYPDQKSFEQAHHDLKGRWDEDEYYWCGEMMIKRLEDCQFSVDYTQVSECAGIYVIGIQAD